MHVVVQFLVALSRETGGATWLANLWDSCDDGLVTAPLALRFLDACAQRWLALPKEGAAGACRWVAGQGSFLRLAKRPAVAHAARLSNVSRYETFVAHHLAPAMGTRAARSLPVPPPAPQLESTRLRLQRDIDRLTAAPAWHQPTATLGRPQPGADNCWVSVDDHADTRPAPAYHAGSTPADRHRDALGLIDTGVDAALVRFEFDAGASFAIAGFDMARPTFADQGNSRFRVRAACRRGRAMSAAGWGSTVHLARLADKRLHPVTGLPERVTSALPIAALRGLKVGYLGGPSVRRGASPDDDDGRFETLVLGRRRPARLVQRLRRYVGL